MAQNVGAYAMITTLTTIPVADHFDRGGFSSPHDRSGATRGGRKRRLPRVNSAIVGDANRTRAFCQSIADILRFQSLPQDWNGEGGLPACEPAVDFAVEVLESLQNLPDICPPFVCPISTGVFLQWQFGEAILYFEVDDESVVWMIQEGDAVLAVGEYPHYDADRACGLVARFHKIDTEPADGITQNA